MFSKHSDAPSIHVDGEQLGVPDLTRTSSEASTVVKCVGPLGPVQEQRRSFRVVRVSARRATEGSPRHQPWGGSARAGFSPEGDTLREDVTLNEVSPAGLSDTVTRQSHGLRRGLPSVALRAKNRSRSNSVVESFQSTATRKWRPTKHGLVLRQVL